MDNWWYDLYDIIQKRDIEVEKLKKQIELWQATHEECIMVQIEFQKEIERIIELNSKFDNI